MKILYFISSLSFFFLGFIINAVIIGIGLQFFQIDITNLRYAGINILLELIIISIIAMTLSMLLIIAGLKAFENLFTTRN